MFILDAAEQSRRDQKTRKLKELGADCQRELLRCARVPGGVRVANLLPENQAMFTEQRLDSNIQREQQPNAYAMRMLAEMVRQDSAYMAHWRADAGEARLFAQMLQHVVSAAVPTLYTANQAKSLFPIDYSLAPGASTILKHRVVDEDSTDLGEISADGDDVHLVDVSGDFDTYRLASFARGMRWNLDELEAAAMSGVPLQTEKAEALNRAVERVFDLVAFQGFAAAGILGFYNQVIAPTAVITGLWLAPATADQILGDIRALIEAVVTATGGTVRPNVLTVPQSRWVSLSMRRVNTDLTVRQMVEQDYPGIRIQECTRANLYDAAGTGPRMAAHVNDPSFVNIGVARSFTLEAPERRGFTYRVIGRQKLAGCINSIPLATGYMDGI